MTQAPGNAGDPGGFWIEKLGLVPHPEGGSYREIHRSVDRVCHPSLGDRPASTLIYYLLREGEWSAWHRIRPEEIWVHLTGSPLVLDWASPDFQSIGRVHLGPPEEPGTLLVHSIPPEFWQAARPESPFSLVMCIVTPGFSFQDLEFLTPNHPVLRDLAPAVLDRISPLMRL